MIQVREVFRIHPERMREAKAAAREMMKLEAGKGFGRSRMLTDLTGDYYTLVIEQECASLGEFEEGLRATTADEQWGAIYGRFRPAIRDGRREIFQIVE